MTDLAELNRHITALQGCRRCPHVQSQPVLGAVPGAQVYLMGQAPGPKEPQLGRPFAWTAGKTLFKWFASIGVAEQDFRDRVYMAAVLRCFPGKPPGGGGDRRPSRKEIATCRAHWETELRLLRPPLVLPVGKMAIELFFDPKTEAARLDDVIGRVFRREHNGHAFDAIPLPHPSGLSRWIQSASGKAKIAEALQHISAHPAWRASFS